MWHTTMTWLRSIHGTLRTLLALKRGEDLWHVSTNPLTSYSKGYKASKILLIIKTKTFYCPQNRSLVLLLFTVSSQIYTQQTTLLRSKSRNNKLCSINRMYTMEAEKSKFKNKCKRSKMIRLVAEMWKVNN